MRLQQQMRLQQGVVGRLAGDEAVGCVVQEGAGRSHHSLPPLYAMAPSACSIFAKRCADTAAVRLRQGIREEGRGERMVWLKI